VKTRTLTLTAAAPASLLAILAAACNPPKTTAAARPAPDRDLITQVSSYDALARGLYDGSSTIESLRHLGDFGLGTLDGWDGEVVVLDSKYLLIGGDGAVREITDFSTTTPFLEVTWFDEDETQPIPDGTDYARLKSSPTAFLAQPNSFYAVKIEGTFHSVKTRSMPKQEKPYKTMAELVKTQPTFDFENVEGVMIGFWSPPSVNGVALAGWHLHFVTKDSKGGGHVIEFSCKDATMILDRSLDFHWRIPDTAEYQAEKF
jgi:acetolactate decarboxylase